VTLRAPLALLLLAGCVSHQVATDPGAGIAVSVGAMLGDSIANVLINRALTADAALQNPDSVYSADAEIVANGELRAEAPRLAGLSPGGRLLLGSSKTMVTSSLIWGSIEYRWIPDFGLCDHHRGTPARRNLAHRASPFIHHPAAGRTTADASRYHGTRRRLRTARNSAGRG